MRKLFGLLAVTASFVVFPAAASATTTVNRQSNYQSNTIAIVQGGGSLASVNANQQNFSLQVQNVQRFSLNIRRFLSPTGGGL